ncbi:MAG: tail fiber domain-containing protein [Verrucomicrobia bacterium]|nr:tail fiber domain-containing protein [Verrucomicrobiota bacterium]
MRGVTYERIDSGTKGVGVIAQEMKEVLPEVVMDASSDDEFMSVSYGNIVGVLIEAIKELKAEIEELKGQNK